MSCWHTASAQQIKHLLCRHRPSLWHRLPQLLVFQILSVITLGQPKRPPPQSFLVCFSYLRQPSQKSSVTVLVGECPRSLPISFLSAHSRVLRAAKNRALVCPHDSYSLRLLSETVSLWPITGPTSITTIWLGNVPEEVKTNQVFAGDRILIRFLNHHLTPL